MSRPRKFCHETRNSWKFMIQKKFSKKKIHIMQVTHLLHYVARPFTNAMQKRMVIGGREVCPIIHHILRESGHKICG